MLLQNKKLAAMSLDDLWALHEEIGAILAERITSQKRELEKRLAVLPPIAGSEAAASERTLMAKLRPRRNYPKVLPRYRNPDTSETWSGRGKRPLWLRSAMASGRSIDEFRI